MKFQTPPVVCDYMAGLISAGCFEFYPQTVLEPTPGQGNLRRAIVKAGHKVYAPKQFEDIPQGSRFDCAVMNPPFTPMAEGYRYLKAVMEMTDNIIALMPWLTIINSDSRTLEIMQWGLRGITHLPRKTFPNSRVQCCVVELRKGWYSREASQFKFFR